VLRIFIIINYLIRYIISILKNNTKYMGFSSNAMLNHKLETKAMDAQGKCIPLGDSAEGRASQQSHCVRQPLQARQSEGTVGGGFQPGNDPNKKKNSLYE
jgi:hypothetical protein